MERAEELWHRIVQNITSTFSQICLAQSVPDQNLEEIRTTKKQLVKKIQKVVKKITKYGCMYVTGYYSCTEHSLTSLATFTAQGTKVQKIAFNAFEKYF